MNQMPTWEEMMIPTLRVLADGAVRTSRAIGPLVADDVQLAAEQRKEVLASGDLKYVNRIGWALSFLAKVGALVRPSRGNYQITEAGKLVLAQFPDGVREKDLAKLGADPNSPVREYVATKRNPSEKASIESVEQTQMTPIEQVEEGIGRIHDEVASELLTRLQGQDPAFFEAAVVKLLLKMGYGGATGGGSVTRLTNDGGIDGVIDQDVLGLRRVYIQAKRYADGNTVQRPEVQGFAGAVHGQADSGVMITTSRFSNGALEFVASTPTRIILIDGKRLAELMIQFGVGVQNQDTYHVVEIDEDFFA